ncbi:hypothetical protein MUK42_05459 [Musa troglodytarum]|uniref:Uncharacterized protein n=1 Tax=Musa troglodytarum TaxID=320322 RepID=A0A9E7ENZ2_9LILI|nr:hypothetical protein MUK42_05459 [Musa troglodytarum]
MISSVSTDGILVDQSQSSPRKVTLAVNNVTDTRGGSVRRSRRSHLNSADERVAPPHSLPVLQPPLLPLPSPATKAGMVRSRGRRMKPKPGLNSRKETLTFPKAARCGSCELEEEPEGRVEKVTLLNEEGEEQTTELIYSLSPPPCSLPLPSFLLTRHRATAACLLHR